MRVMETGSYVVVHFGLCEAGKGGVGDGLFFFFFIYFFLAHVSHSNKWHSYAQNVFISLHNFYLNSYIIFFYGPQESYCSFFFFFERRGRNTVQTLRL